jgi:hypothetical protein
MCLLSVNGFSQTDTVYLIKSDTVFEVQKQDLLYRLLVEDRGIETGHLWKINIVDIGFLKPNLGYEQLITGPLTIEGYFSYGAASVGFVKDGVYSFLHNSSVELEQQFKYYYNLRSRERSGKKIYGFSANYVSSSLWYSQNDDMAFTTDSTSFPNVKRYNLGFKYGIQRRIGNLAYVDVYAGVYYCWEEIISTALSNQKVLNYNNYVYPVLGIKAGFAIDSFANLKRMLK